MPGISQKGRQMPASPIRKLVPFADKSKQKGIKVYHLNIGQPDIETPEVALKAIHNFQQKVIEYSHSAGIISYRRKLAAYYEKIGLPVSPDEIIVTCGASEAILFAMQTTMDPGDEIIIPEPFYANYNGFAINSGVVVKPIPSRIEDGFALPPISEFEKAITPRTKAIMICNPNNPTGYLYSREELEVLREIALKYDLYLFADEVYREFCYDGKKHFSVMQLEGLEQHAILIDSVSKRYSECGVRIGCMISRNKDVIATAMKFAQARLSPPTLGQVVAEASLDTPQDYFDKVLNEYLARRNTVVSAINKMPGAFCPNPQGAFYVVARLPIDNSDKFCQWLLESFEYKGATVMLAPATGFYATPGKGTDEVRISYVLNVEDLTRSMECLAEALKVYPGRTL
ncbi:MAG: pyridoxal phosphate-dependent aminotransferase [Bacteroidales bacterium]|jgi:aspartate aminotransferase|nr:pyridoxal phosphate-dependent aminotransferase [Bacteroidales bacterium]NPV37483.1 pyridoxal phosphate-dependent aminotransferase [Bacteroidales bacterium]